MPPHKEDGACTIENVVAVVEQAEDTQPVDQLLTSSLVVDKDADCILLAVTVILLTFAVVHIEKVAAAAVEAKAAFVVVFDVEVVWVLGAPTGMR